MQLTSTALHESFCTIKELDLFIDMQQKFSSNPKASKFLQKMMSLKEKLCATYVLQNFTAGHSY